MKEGQPCYTRKSELHILAGGLLEFWKRLNDISQCSDYLGRVYYVSSLHSSTSNGPNYIKKRTPLEIVRVVTDAGDPIVGYKAVSEQEMAFFKTQMLLPPGHPDDVYTKKFGTASLKKQSHQNGKKRRFTLSDRHDAPNL